MHATIVQCIMHGSGIWLVSAGQSLLASVTSEIAMPAEPSQVQN